MICKRRMHRLRSHKCGVILISAMLFLGIVVTYNTLSGHDTSAHLRSYLPFYDSGRSQSGNNHGGILGMESAGFGRDPLLRLGLPGKRLLKAVNGEGLQEVLRLLYPRSWRWAKAADEMAIVLKDRLLELNLTSPMSCGDITRHQLQGTLSFSNRKFIDRLDRPKPSNFDPYNSANSRNRTSTAMVVKSQRDGDHRTRMTCLKEAQDMELCDNIGNYLMMRELFLLRVLSHPNLIALLGYCLRGDGVSHVLAQKGVVLVLELGAPFVPTLASNLPWPRRVQLAHGVSSLMAYLESTPLGSVGLPGVKPKDFVLVKDRTLKLTDLDDAQLEEKACTTDSDCFLENVDIGVACSLGQCRGLNQMINLRVLGGPMLIPLLQNAPSVSDQQQVEDILTRVRRLNISSAELLAFMNTLVEKYCPKQSADSEMQEAVDSKIQPEVNDTNNAVTVMSAESNSTNGVQHRDNAGVQSGVLDLSQQYQRINSSNFPSQYDFSCPGTRVTWGCVLVVQNLMAAMLWCTSHTHCRSFVVFSAHPEDNNKVAVVFKNGNFGPPKSSSGTTLYLLKDSTPLPQANHPQSPAPASQLHGAAGVSEVRGQGQGEQKAATLMSVPERLKNNSGVAGMAGQRDGRDGRQQGVGTVTKADPWDKVKETESCVQRGHDSHEESLHVREKRIMAAMGMKGTRESDWRQAVQVEKVWDFSDVHGVSMAGADMGALGGLMVVHFSTDMPGHEVRQAIFMVEKGPRQNHVAFALLYALDRLLGLYHVVPTVEGFLRGSVVARFARDKSWHSVFGPLTHPDGTLRGLFVAVTPQSVQTSELSIRPLDRLTTQVKALTNTQRKHLEYVLLWWMAHLAKNNTHLGVRGQLFHVDGDLSFQDLGTSYDGYLYHCQFPAIVYTVLDCFRCLRPQTICQLGQQVVRQVMESGFKMTDLHIPQLTEQDYPRLINTAASQVIQIVDACVHKFGRDAVLY